MDKGLAKKWVAALRSGKYVQGSARQLEDGNGGYCCLGVLNCVAGEPQDYDLPAKIFGGIGLGDILLDDGATIELASLNDGGSDLPNFGLKQERYTFNEIADIIQIEFVEGL